MRLFYFFLFLPLPLLSQQDSLRKIPAVPVEKKWYENIAIRGYAQFRYNRLFETNENLGCESCDRSWGKNGGFFIRRMRVIIFGQISKNVYLYVQPDFASSPATDRLHFGQLRDAYIDVGLDKDNEFRFRIGQSKVPYGFENMQSSQNRLPLDRADALNSAVSNERDLGVFFYWAPKKTRELFVRLVRDGLKGSGDYGVFGLGVYNGQTANNPELNNEPHIITRFTYPFQVNKQIIELGIQAYTGKYVIPRTNLSPGVKTNADLNYLDRRIAGTFVLYPQPFGILAEYTFGRGPEFNKITILLPFARYQYYRGGKKHERDARSHHVRELELGAEWQLNKNFELVMNYTFSRRRFEDFQLPNNLQEGSLLRIQAQVNF